MFLSMELKAALLPGVDGLHERLRNQVMVAPPDRETVPRGAVMPSLAHLLFSKGASVLRVDPSATLAAEPIGDRVSHISGSATRQMARVVDTSLSRNPAVSPRLRFTSPPQPHATDACWNTENRFFAVHRTMSGSNIVTDRCVTVIVDEDGDPAFVKDAGKIPGGLALRPYAVNGVEFPAGTISRVYTRGKVDMVVQGRYGPVPEYVYPRTQDVLGEGNLPNGSPCRIVSTKAVTGIWAVRQTGWSATEEAERQEFFRGGWNDPDEMAAVSIGDFARHAKTIVRRLTS